jgi:hypothetical protein
MTTNNNKKKDNRFTTDSNFANTTMAITMIKGTQGSRGSYVSVTTFRMVNSVTVTK